MFDEPEDNSHQDAVDPAQKARDKCDEFRTFAEQAAVFEGVRKFDAQIYANLDAEIARQCQRTVGKLEKSRSPESPIIPPDISALALELLDVPTVKEIPTNDYHIYRRPGEVMIVRWLDGELVETFYTRLQAHFDVALNQFREDEKQALSWKQDPTTAAYLDALEKLEVKMEERYLRPVIRQHKIFVLSTQTADEMDILHLCDFVMGVPAGEVVGEASAPPDDPTERDRAWFFKLFSLRGIKDDVERMCFFTYLQKSDDSGDWEG